MSIIESTFELGEAEWVIHRYRDTDIVIEPGGTAYAIVGEIEAMSVRFKPARGTIICNGTGDITVPTMEALGEWLKTTAAAPEDAALPET